MLLPDVRTPASSGSVLFQGGSVAVCWWVSHTFASRDVLQVSFCDPSFGFRFWELGISAVERLLPYSEYSYSILVLEFTSNEIRTS